MFRPRCEPEQSIYDAFQEEAIFRKTRTIEEWVLAERLVVFSTACELASLYNLNEPTMDQVKRAEDYACGHTDYGAKWAYRLVELMRK